MQEIVNALTWTFIHSLWLGLLAALLSAIIISSTRKATARLRYNLLGIIMILFFAGTIITFLVQWHVEPKPVTASPTVIIEEVQLINSTNGLIDNFIDWVNTNSNTIIVIWTFFFLFSCLRLVTGLAAVNRLKYYKTHPVTTDWKVKLEELQLMLGIRYPVSFLQSELVKVPIALGILKPVILIPMGILTHLPPEQVETILLHELAHIRRRDFLFNLLQHIVEAIFFFNPAIRWISSLIREEREASCDDIVIANCKQKTNYLNALVSFQEYTIKHNTPYAMGIGSKRHFLLTRVKRIIMNKNKGINLFEKIGLLAGVFLVSAFCFITKEPAIEPLKTDSYQVEQPAENVLPIVVSKPQQDTIKKGKYKLINKPSRDTIPARKNKTLNKQINNNNTRLPTQNEWEQAAQDAKVKLQEIIYLKDQIGVRKAGIEVIKKQLTITDGKEKQKIQKELDKERDELDKQRKQLDLKREQLVSLKEKVKSKQVEEKDGDDKKLIEPKKIAPPKSNDDKQWDKSDQWDKSIRPDKSAEWNKSVEPDKSNVSDKWDGYDENTRKKFGRKTGRVPTISKPKNIEVDNNSLNKQEYQYKIKLPVKDPPPAVKQAPENLNRPGTPANKAKPAGPGTGN